MFCLTTQAYPSVRFPLSRIYAFLSSPIRLVYLGLVTIYTRSWYICIFLAIGGFDFFRFSSFPPKSNNSFFCVALFFLFSFTWCSGTESGAQVFGHGFIIDEHGTGSFISGWLLHTARLGIGGLSIELDWVGIYSVYIWLHLPFFL